MSVCKRYFVSREVVLFATAEEVQSIYIFAQEYLKISSSSEDSNAPLVKTQIDSSLIELSKKLEARGFS